MYYMYVHVNAVYINSARRNDRDSSVPVCVLGGGGGGGWGGGVGR